MRTEPANISHSLLVEALRDYWRIDVSALTYAKVGFGSHHWVATLTDGTRRFITVDDLIDTETQLDGSTDAHFAGLRAAFATATSLRDNGLDFVLAPLPTMHGEPLARLAPEWSLAVFPYVEGEPLGDGAWEDVPGEADAARLIARVHAATPPQSIGRWRPAIPKEAQLDMALADIDSRWSAGPYGERARAALRAHRHALTVLRSEYERLASLVMASPEPWVVTHGEPHSANFLRGMDGELALIDWDTALLAPRERDLPFGEEALAVYRDLAGGVGVRAEARELFRLRWSLADICAFVGRLRGPHAEAEDDADRCRYLEEELERVAQAV